MYLQNLLSVIYQTDNAMHNMLNSDVLKSVFGVLMATNVASTLFKKQLRRLKWKVGWHYLKNKFSFKKKQKGTNKGLLILGIVLGLLCFGVAKALGMLVEFLILIGAVVLFIILFLGAKAKINI